MAGVEIYDTFSGKIVLSTHRVAVASSSVGRTEYLAVAFPEKYRVLGDFEVFR